MRGWWWNFVSQPWVTCKWNRHWAGIPGEEHQEFAMWGTVYLQTFASVYSTTWGSIYVTSSDMEPEFPEWGKEYEWGYSMWEQEGQIWGEGYEWLSGLEAQEFPEWGEEYNALDISDPLKYAQWGAGYGIVNL